MTAVASTFVQILKTNRFPGMLQNILNPGADIVQGREPDLRPTLRCCPICFIFLLKHLQKDQLSQYPPKTIRQIRLIEMNGGQLLTSSLRMIRPA